MSSPANKEQALIEAWTRTYAAGRMTSWPSASILPVSSTVRGGADAMAAWRRWHDPRPLANFTHEEQAWFSLLERARVETLASHELPGIAHNLSNPLSIAPPRQDMAALYHAARLAFQARPLPDNMLLSSPQEHSSKSVLKRAWGQLLGRQATPAPSPPPVSDHQLREVLQKAAECLHDSGAFASTVAPLVEQLALFYQTNQPSRPQANDHIRLQDEDIEEEESDDASETNTGLAEELAERDDKKQQYAVFSRQWDETQPASYWLKEADKEAFKQLHQLDQRRIKQLAHRLQRRLLAASQRRWLFDQEDGRLDNRRLARLLDDKPTQRVFRIEQAAPMPAACVTLLVDQSGSMDIKRRQMAAMAIEFAVHTLEMCKIRCEVLGFTTRYTADNPVFRRWQQRGQPEHPGRLNALQHIIYKTPEQPWRRTRHHLSLLLRQMPGHENIDGEALHWAASRLSRQPEPRKIMLVISDGAPYDKATAQANGRDFLEHHLRHIIGDIEKSPISLAAIGTGQNVARFYQNSVTVRRPDAVAETLFEQLGNLLVPAQINEGSS
ncbi:cobaltochelatase CobT-related protein [Vreelandella sulfidaeris]|uniref:cobaltochelatase CobT-related protein n=1 Tax=Vreelandella sulfidaeris TaxID=115553 RepID=UPI0035EA10E3